MAKFNPYNVPCPPHKPEEFITKKEILLEMNISSYGDSFSVNYIPAGTERIYIDVERDGDDITIGVEFQKFHKEKNPQYPKLLQKYESDFIKYKQELVEWNRQKKLYDKAEKEKQIQARRLQYEKLKKEFEKDAKTSNTCSS